MRLMQSRSWFVFALGLALAGCQTLTEEGPASPTSPNDLGGAPPALVVVPVALPSPTTGGGGATPPTPTNPPRSPSTTPSTAPGNTPGSAPPPVPAPGTGVITRVGAKVYFIECNGQPIPGTERATRAPVGCRLHLDATGRDANNVETNARRPPVWTYSDERLFSGGQASGDYTPTLNILRAGHLSLYCTMDGVASNTVNIEFYNE